MPCQQCTCPSNHQHLLIVVSLPSLPPSLPCSRIGAVHASSGGATPPTLSTGQRATHYQERSAEKQQREAAEAEQREAKRLAQLVGVGLAAGGGVGGRERVEPREGSVETVVWALQSGRILHTLPCFPSPL